MKLKTLLCCFTLSLLLSLGISTTGHARVLIACYFKKVKEEDVLCHFRYTSLNANQINLAQVFDDGSKTVLQFNHPLKNNPTITDEVGRTVSYIKAKQYLVLPRIYSHLTVKVESHIASITLNPTSSIEPTTNSISSTEQAQTSPSSSTSNDLDVIPSTPLDSQESPIAKDENTNEPLNVAKIDVTEDQEEEELSPEEEITRTIQTWARAWSHRNVKWYLSFYAPDFQPANETRRAWENTRRQRLTTPKKIKVTVDNIRIDFLNPNKAEVTFVQSYTSDIISSDVSTKRLILVKAQDKWLIQQEKK